LPTFLGLVVALCKDLKIAQRIDSKLPRGISGIPVFMGALLGSLVYFAIKN